MLRREREWPVPNRSLHVTLAFVMALVAAYHLSHLPRRARRRHAVVLDLAHATMAGVMAAMLLSVLSPQASRVLAWGFALAVVPMTAAWVRGPTSARRTPASVWPPVALGSAAMVLMLLAPGHHGMGSSRPGPATAAVAAVLVLSSVAALVAELGSERPARGAAAAPAALAVGCRAAMCATTSYMLLGM